MWYSNVQVKKEKDDDEPKEKIDWGSSALGHLKQEKDSDKDKKKRKKKEDDSSGKEEGEVFIFFFTNCLPWGFVCGILFCWGAIKYVP